MERIILDVAAAGDDILGILFAAAWPDIRLEGVTTAMGVAGAVGQVTAVAVRTLALAGRDDVPVHAGAWRPIVGTAMADGAALARLDQHLTPRFGRRFADLAAPAAMRPATPGHAVDFIIATVMGAPGEITLVTTGPVTNVALALLQEPRLAGALKRLVVRGGAFAAPGNVTPLAEYNIRADPEAARIALAADVPKILVPLDACEDNRAAASMLTRNDIADLVAACPGDRVVEALARVFPAYIDVGQTVLGLAGLPMGDVIAVALAARPDLATLGPPVFCDVVLDGGLARGQICAHLGRHILPGGGPQTTRIAMDIDGRALRALFTSVQAHDARPA